MEAFEIGDLVWAKMKRYPPWPARIIEPVHNVKPPKSKEPVYCVIFFGTRRKVAFIAASDIISYENGKVKYKQKKIGGAYKAAVEEMDAAAMSELNSVKTSFSMCDDDSDEEPLNISYKRKMAARNVAESKGIFKSNKKAAFGKGKRTMLKKFGSSRKSLYNPAKNKKFSITRSCRKSVDNDEEEEMDDISDISNSVSMPVAKMSLRLISPSLQAVQKSGKGAVLSPKKCTQIPLPLYDQVTEIGNAIITLSSTKIGFIGLGAMGKVILKHLLNSQIKRDITIWNRSEDKYDEFRKTCAVAESPADLMTKCDIIISCVSDRSAVNQIVRSEQYGILNGLTIGKGYVEMTTIDPDYSQCICKDITSRHGRYLEVQMLGKRTRAKDASLLLLAAGDKELYRAISDCFKDIAKRAFFLGDVGNASKMSLIVNMVLGTCLASVTEAINFAEHTGIYPKDFIDLLEQGNLNCPAIIEQGRAIIELLKDPEKKFDIMPVEHMQRNLHLALEVANSNEKSIPTVAAVNDMFTFIRRRDEQNRSFRYGEVENYSDYSMSRSDVTEMYKILSEEENQRKELTKEWRMDGSSDNNTNNEFFVLYKMLSEGTAPKEPEVL